MKGGGGLELAVIGREVESTLDSLPFHPSLIHSLPNLEKRKIMSKPFKNPEQVLSPHRI